MYEKAARHRGDAWVRPRVLLIATTEMKLSTRSTSVPTSVARRLTPTLGGVGIDRPDRACRRTVMMFRN